MKLFFEQHPEHAAHKDAALAKANELANDRNLMVGDTIDEVMGDLADQFIDDLTKSDHVDICLGDME